MTFADVIAKVIGLINIIIPVLLALALVFFVLTGVRYIWKAGEGGAEVRTQLLWGLIALFVLFTVWGLVNVMCATLLGHSCRVTGNSSQNTTYSTNPTQTGDCFMFNGKRVCN